MLTGTGANVGCWAGEGFGAGVGEGAAAAVEVGVAGDWAGCSDGVGVGGGPDDVAEDPSGLSGAGTCVATSVGSIAACVVAGTGTGVAVRSGSGSCPHPANTNTLNDSTNTSLQCAPSILAKMIFIQTDSFVRKLFPIR